jgi:hypothetical protein
MTYKSKRLLQNSKDNHFTYPCRDALIVFFLISGKPGSKAYREAKSFMILYVSIHMKLQDIIVLQILRYITKKRHSAIIQ